MTETQVAKTYLETMTRSKTYIFTIAKPISGKPIVRAEMTTDMALRDQEKAEDLIRSWAESALDLYDRDQIGPEIEDLAYSMRKDGCAWWNETYCFELTEVYG